jgi:hypothetical protein
LKRYSEKLTDLFKQMNEKLSQFGEQTPAVVNTSNTNLEPYKKILHENTKEIEELITSIQTSDEAIDTTSRMVIQSDLKYRFWVLFIIILFFVAYKIAFLKDKPTNPAMAFWAISTIILIILSYNLANSSGFMLWGFFLAFYVLMASGILRIM